MGVLEASLQKLKAHTWGTSHEALLEALGQFPDGETPRVIRESAGVSGKVANQIFESLVEEELIEECVVKKHTREERAYRLKATQSAS